MDNVNFDLRKRSGFKLYYNFKIYVLLSSKFLIVIQLKEQWLLNT